jgi:uncharacterized damage-inducible protein DinB
MEPKLEKTYQQLEAQRQRLWQELSSVSGEQWNQSPAEGKWSLAQVLTHVVTSEQLSVNYMKKKSLAMESLDCTGWWEEAKLVLLIILQRIPIKYKAPRTVVERTPPAMSQAELQKAWEAVRADLKNLLLYMKPEDARKKVYKHPIAGRLNIQQCMIFLREHLIHHQPQIHRLLHKKM